MREIREGFGTVIGLYAQMWGFCLRDLCTYSPPSKINPLDNGLDKLSHGGALDNAFDGIGVHMPGPAHARFWASSELICT